ncbi:xanthine dehydrogenase subunit D [Bacillus gobiensis]|uniref:Xanthine dehydrogenase subunit D n=1 Tax=Bacillus gobiensis TaxID=1441095 RepID=A0A0M4G9X8_9BACI|nr:xanthine dehydrogenase subunit D [Bacillus gobiensis]ALC82270.1 xanthine dehydrogenase [Bacillus gobiensis]
MDGKNRVRPDGKTKVTGTLKYMTDLTFPNMLYAKVLRSEFPHAEIKSISTDRASTLPGVKAVITYKDVPGMNRFGIVFPDQPVLCEDRVRYVGDAIAAVAAKTEDIAVQALSFIEVEYEPLQVVDDPEKALEPGSPKLHDNGNILHEAGHQHGDVEAGFRSSDLILAETYHLPRQMHTYMETEGGVVVPEKDGAITVYAGTQHGYKDRFQLSRILAMPEEDIRIVSSPIGGSFGGKDELNIQPYAALLAIVTKQPVKIHQTRKESVRSGIKRHPMKITMKTGVTVEGKIQAQYVKIVADTGAYATLGPAVLDFSVEHAAGPYLIPNLLTEGISVYTNNGVAGEFRGFGGNQITFALESQMDRLAEKLGMDPLQIRRINLREAKDPGPMNHRIAPTDGAANVLETIAKSPLLHVSKKSSSPFKKKGVGAAITMHGGGLGYGRLDPSGGRLSLSEEGKIVISFGFEECGQGILAVIENLVTDELGCSTEDLQIIIGDTEAVPVSGSSTASRGTSMVWQAIQLMKPLFIKQLIEKAAELTNLPAESLLIGPGGLYQKKSPVISFSKLAAQGFKESSLVVDTSFQFPTTPDPVIGGHFLYSFGAVALEVEVDLLTGMVQVTDMEHAVAAGPVVSKQGYTGQIEGGAMMALGYTLSEEAAMSEGRYLTGNLDTYLIPGIQDVPPDINIHAIEELCEGDIYGPRGVGEIGTVAVAPAIAKAVHDAVGYWVNRLPISSEELLDAIDEKGEKAWI